MITALILLPALAGLLAFLLRADAPRRALLVATALGHAGLTAAAWQWPPAPTLDGWLALDAVGLLFLSTTSALFLAVAVYAVGYLAREEQGTHQDLVEGIRFSNSREAVFTGCLLTFLATMTLATTSHHLGLLWVAIEATTLTSAPLIYFHRHHRSLEAVWKYLLVCSVGLALALLGNLCLAISASAAGHQAETPLVGTLVAHAGSLSLPWLQTAFVLSLVGYGTKMGLAPLHTWKPDTYSEAPSLVAALMGGALANCAFLGILRVQQITVAAGIAGFGQELLVAFGLISMFVAGIFIVRQADFKRLLAFSSVEHVGILALGVGLGGGGVYGAMLHAVNHSLTKAMLFLLAGNLMAVYRTKKVAGVRGALYDSGLTGPLWLLGCFAITGAPPFGMFLSEFTILQTAVAQSRWLVAALYLILLAVIVIGLVSAFLAMSLGEPEEKVGPGHRSWLTVAPPLALGLAALSLGLYVPPSLSQLMHEAARGLGGLG